VTDHRLLVFSNGQGHGVDNLDELVGSLPGCVAARRYRCNEHQRSTAIACPWAYLTIYELQADDLAATYTALAAVSGPDDLARDDAAAADRQVAWTYTPLAAMLRQSEDAAARKIHLGTGEHQFVILTNPTEGRERDFLRWYDAHVPEILDNYPGLTTGQLFKAAATQPPRTTLEWEYLALYDLDADDVAEYFEHEPHGLEGMTEPDGALGPRPAQWVFSPTGPRVTSPGIQSTPVPAKD